MAKVAVVYHSGYGHTAVLADSVIKGAEAAGAEVTRIAIDGLGADFAALAAQAGEADALIFGSPTYVGTVSAPMKAFMDATAGIWFHEGWKDKFAAGFTVSNSFSGDKLMTLQTLSGFAAQHGMIWISLGVLPGEHAHDNSAPNGVNRLGSFLGMMGQADNVAAEQSPPAGDHQTAFGLGERVARLTQRFVN